MPRYFEDVDVGTVRELGTVEVSEEDIVDFGEQWDPLPQHTDAEAASRTLPGQLLASGLHTLCLSNRLVATEFRRHLAGAVGLGISDLRFVAPVRPGDALTVRHEVVEKRPSESDPGVGVVRAGVEVEKRSGETVLEYDTAGLFLRRDVTGDPDDGGGRAERTGAGESTPPGGLEDP